MDTSVSIDEVREDLNFVEKVIASITGSDNFQAAMLHNQKVQTQLLSQMAGVDMGNSLDPASVDMDDLPIGLVGTAESNVPKGDWGRAVFDIGGSKYEARVKAGSDIEKNETVVINEDGNIVRPGSSASDALSMMVGSGQSGRNSIMRPDSVGIHETSDLEHSNGAGSIILEPGDEVAIASTGQDVRQGYLLGAGAYNGSGVRYGISVDGEYIVGGWTNSPLGSLNDPFWFPESMGGVIPFSQGVKYRVRYPESETGQVEVTSRMYTQEV